MVDICPIRVFHCLIHLKNKKMCTCHSYKKNQLVLCKTMTRSGSHLGIPINIKNTKFVKDLPMIDAHFRFNQCNSFREEYISVGFFIIYKMYSDLNSSSCCLF
jgi:hypothetical protein